MKKTVLGLCLILLLTVSCSTKNKDEKKDAGIKNDKAAVEISEGSIESPLYEQLTGTMLEIIENEGTFSEVRYFVIASDNGIKTILFNEKGFSEGFNTWIGRKVLVQGYKDTGLIGFKRVKKTGFAVVKIRASE